MLRTAGVRKISAITTAVTAAALLAVLPTAASAQRDGFSDVSDDSAHSAAITALDSRGVFEGTLCGEEMFCPWEPLSRSDMAVWLVRIVDGTDPEPVTDTRFGDVDGDHPHAAFIERFAALGVTEGCATAPLRYCPDRSVTRAQMASFLVRAFDLAAAEPAGFSDVAAGGAHSANIDALAAAQITVGCGTDPLRYCPQDDVARSQMATFLVRADEHAPTTTEPEEEHHPDFSQYEPGDIVNVAELWPDEGFPEDFVCELLDNGEFVGDDGYQNCWRTSEVAAPDETEPEPDEAEPAVVARVAEPMTRCASDTGWYGAGRVSVYVGTAADGFYEPVVEGGEGSCERIKAWWDEITRAEAQRIAEGQYPCEHGAAYDWWNGLDVNGPALLAGCWPRLLDGTDRQFRLDDPDEEATRINHLEGSYILPPNHPAMVEALYGCYRDALQGPPVGWTSPSGGAWVTPILCHYYLDNFGPPVRHMGVTAECAAEQLSERIEERKTRGYVGRDYPTLSGDSTTNRYAGEHSWANCETHASRLLPDAMRAAPFRQRCEAVIDAAAAVWPEQTDAAARLYGLTAAEYIAQTKDMYCEGSRTHLLNYPQFHGRWVASWLPLDGTVCWEAALMEAARQAVYEEGLRVAFC